MKVCLENCLEASLEALLTSAQVEISHQLLGLSDTTLDLKCIYDLVIGNCVQYYQPQSVVLRCHNDHCAHRKCDATVGKDWKKAPESTTFFEVYHSLLRVQKEQNTMLKKAKEEACKEGKDITTVAWYDFSGCRKKYSELRV